jgi:alpha-mannosidase
MGQSVPSQRLTTGELAVLVESVPPLGATRLYVGKGSAFKRGSAVTTGDWIENGDIALHVNGKSGAIDSFLWKRKNTSLVDRQAASGLGEYLYVHGTDPTKAQRLSGVHVRVKENGPLVVSLLIKGDTPGARKYSSEARLVAGLNRVDIFTKFDKLAVREKESVHFAFPFRVPGAQMRYDVADGIVRAPEDQLAGACKNFFSAVSWTDVSNTEYGVTLAVPDAPLVEMGAITAEQPWLRTIQSSPVLYSYALNNYWHTNYKADQEGPESFAYAIQPHAAFSSAAAARFGRERREPLVVAPADESHPAAKSLFQISPNDVMVSSVKPISGGDGSLVYLYNPSGADQRITLQFDPAMRVTVRKSDAFGKVVEGMTGTIPIAAYGSVYVRVDRVK